MGMTSASFVQRMDIFVVEPLASPHIAAHAVLTAVPTAVPPTCPGRNATVLTAIQLRIPWR